MNDPPTGARYDTIGSGYARYRRPDPRIAAQIDAAVGDARAVVDVGSGTGSYEPRRPMVVAVEPSWTMIAQRARGSAPVVRAVAEALPFPSGAFDVALAILTVHHWRDVMAGLAELRRVSRRQIVFTWDAAVYHRTWLLAEYVPEIPAAEVDTPTARDVVEALGPSRVDVVPVPWDCSDGFLGSYWRRPEMYLDPDARAAISGLARLDASVVERAMARLRADLESGAWARRHADILGLETIDLGYRLVVAGR